MSEMQDVYLQALRSLQETFAGFAVTLRGRIQGLRRAEVTFWKRDMGYVGWGVARKPNLRASLLIFWVVRNKAGGLYKMPTGLKELFGKASTYTYTKVSVCRTSI